MKKGQVSFEYIMVVGIAMLLILPGAVLFHSYSRKIDSEVARSKIELVGNEIVDSVEKVYYIGENSWETLKLEVPNNVRSIYILNNIELVISYESNSGYSEAVFFSDINMTGDPAYLVGSRQFISNETHSGLNIIKVKSKGTYVLINESQ